MGEVEFGVFVRVAGFCVEGVYLVARVFPVPGKSGNAAQAPEFFCRFDDVFRVSLIPPVRGFDSGGEQKIEADQGGVFSCPGIEGVHVEESLDG